MAQSGEGDGEGHLLLGRDRLVERIIHADGAPVVTTVVAPAGYGKTTLLRRVADEADEAGFPALVLSLADCEHHPGLFLDRLAEAVRRRLPRADIKPLLMLKKAAPAEEYGERLPWVLDRLLEPVAQVAATLVLDDVQHLEAGEPLADVLRGLLRSEPRRLRFVLASRRAIPVDLTPYRQRGELVELTGADLAFTLEEVRELLDRVVGEVTPILVQRVWERTRGWPGVMGLLATLMRDRSDEELASLVDGIAGEEEAVVDFVVHRLLAEYPPPLQYFLKVVSVLERVEPGAVRALFGEGGGRRSLRSAGRYLIALPEGQIPAYLERLEHTQVLLPAEGDDDGDTLEMSPLVRETLRNLLAQEDARVYREAHRRAADYRLDRGRTVEATSLDHLVAAGDYDRVLYLLEGEAERFFASGYHRQLAHWLLSLESHYASLPFWADYYVGRIHVGMGEWDRARAYLDRCKAHLNDRQRAGDLWRWQPRVCLGYAAMYWRRGMHSEASTYCRRGLDFLRQLRRRGGLPEEHRSEAAGVQLHLLNLLGTVKMETGSYDSAEQVCVEARDLARTEKRPRDEALARKNLGLIATRRGAIQQASEHLETALERVDPAADPELHASIAYVLGLNHRMAGRHQDALDLMTRALPEVEDTGRPETIATMLATVGEVHGSLGEHEEADRAFRRAMRLLDSIGDVKVKVEVLDRYLIYLARHGRVHEASLIQERSAGLVEGLLRTEVHVSALHSEAQAEWCAARGHLGRALTHVRQASERYTRVGAAFHVARLAWRKALLEHQQFVAGEVDSPEAVMEALEGACDAARRHGYHFEIGSEYAEILHVGAAYGEEEEVASYCAEALERLTGEPVDAEAPPDLSEEALARYRDYRRRAELADEYVIVTREERQGANARQVEELLEEEGARSLVVVVYDQLMVNRGKEISLAEKRVILPLLLHFLRNPDQVFTMDELAESVWQSQSGKSSMQTKVKVAISRLRALLGKDRKYVVTARVDKPGGGTQVAYGLAADLGFFLVDRIEEEDEDEEAEREAAED
ncbi:MAG: tetratricopeptide repeat protein [Myxococcota bacterium]